MSLVIELLIQNAYHNDEMGERTKDTKVRKEQKKLKYERRKTVK